MDQNPTLTSSAARAEINRFVSTLAGAFRSFFMYKHDNKALDEILQNLVARFENASAQDPLIKLGVTNRSLVYEGEAIGYKEITVLLAAQLQSLAFKEIIFKGPIQSRHFFQLLNILSCKEPNEGKIEKLLPLLADGAEKPIALVPITSNLSVLNLPGEMMGKRLAPLLVKKSDEGPGFIEDLNEADLKSLSDLFTWICVKVEPLEENLKQFIRDLVDATREGYLPIDRFMSVFPLPEKMKNHFEQMLANKFVPRARRPTELGHEFKTDVKRLESSRADWNFHAVAYSLQEVLLRKETRADFAQEITMKELELTENLLQEEGANFLMGLRFLTRFLRQKNAFALQEKALSLAMEAWLKNQNKMDDDIIMASLLSSLRESLCSINNITIQLFPLRTAMLESESFNQLSASVLSLGQAALPSLIQVLDVEQDRSLRKKLCHLITVIARQQGVAPLIAALHHASPFLLRNIIMILGDIKTTEAVATIGHQALNPQKIVAVEAVRSLIKINNEEAGQILSGVLTRTPDFQLKKMALDYLVAKKDRRIVEKILRMAKDPASPEIWKRSLYSALGVLGGLQAKEFLESLVQNSSFLSRFKPEEREQQELIKNVLSRITL